MKSIKSLASACLLTVAALASCGGGEEVQGAVKNIQGGSADERSAIQKCVSTKPIAILQGVTLNLTDTFDVSADAGDYLQINTKQGGIEVNMTMYTVDIEWEVDTNSPYFASMDDISATQKIINFNFPDDRDGSYQLKIAKISCGGAVSEDPQCAYNLKIKKPVYKHVDTTISALNKISDAPIEKNEFNDKDGEYGYDLIKYDQKSPYWVGNNPGTEKDYYYVNVNGEIIYSAPDGNWALLADGDEIMEVYAGSAYNLTPETYPALSNKYVEVVGNMGQYTGNIQLGFVTAIKELSSSASYQPAAATKQYAQLDIASLENGAAESGKHKQAIQGMMNSLKYVEGTIVSGSWKKDGSTMSSHWFSRLLPVHDHGM